MRSIFEGPHDKNTYKAVFLAGAPASGKTEFYKYSLSGKNLKHLDSDRVLEFLVKKEGGDMMNTSNYSKFQKRTNEILGSMVSSYISGGLGLVIDGTGQSTSKYLEIKSKLEEKGYKTMMVFISRPIEKSKEYARTRKRAVDSSYIETVARNLKQNIGVYKDAFSTFVEVEGMNDNSYLQASKVVNKFLLTK